MKKLLVVLIHAFSFSSTVVVIHLQFVIRKVSYSYMECSLTIVMRLSVEASPSKTQMHQRLAAVENRLQRRLENII